MRIAITGISGSLGRALLHRLAHEGADRIVGCSRDEHKRAALQAEYAWQPAVKVYAGDIRDEDRLRDVFAGCEWVIHAAARKVVSGHHDEPREMMLTNVVGTANVLAAARHAGVGKLLFVSSDKAVEPINVYGATKMVAEQLVISENARCFASGLRCGVVRYGNVIGSNGSVVKVWREKIAAGEPLPISDRRMTRFWLTIDEAAARVLRAVGDLRGGEVFVPRIKAAPLMRLLDAVAPERDDLQHRVVGIKEIGIRPGGEKMHEILVGEDEIRRARMKNGWIIVPPAESTEAWDPSPWLGEHVPEDFRYCSEDWPEQWSVEELREVLGVTKKREAVDA